MSYVMRKIAVLNYPQNLASLRFMVTKSGAQYFEYMLTVDVLSNPIYIRSLWDNLHRIERAITLASR